jgi:hypothetical protein
LEKMDAAGNRLHELHRLLEELAVDPQQVKRLREMLGIPE